MTPRSGNSAGRKWVLRVVAGFGAGLCWLIGGAIEWAAIPARAVDGIAAGAWFFLLGVTVVLLVKRAERRVVPPESSSRECSLTTAYSRRRDVMFLTLHITSRAAAEAGGWADKRRTRNGATASELLQAVFPITRFPAVVRNGEDSDMRRHFQVDDVIGKSRYGTASNGQINWQSADPGTGERHRYDLINCCVNGIEELDAQVISPSLVPTAGEAVFGVRLVVKADARIHRLRSSASARRRTSSQATPLDSSARARRARRSISAAQAASTSAGRSAAASSRLANSSAATSARSSRGSAKASRRTSCARDVMRPFYTDRQPNTALHPTPPELLARRSRRG